MTTKAKGTSVRQKLINLRVEIGVPYQNLETAFILERLVARLIPQDFFETILRLISGMEREFLTKGS